MFDCLKGTLFFIVLSIFPLLVKSQSTSFEQDVFTSGLHVSVYGTSGFTKFDFVPNTIISLNSPLLTQNTLSVDLQYYLKNGYFISSSVGMLVTTQKNYQKTNGMDWYHYRDGLTWLEYKKIDFGFGYTKLLNRSLFKGHLQLGVLKRYDSKLSRFDGIFDRFTDGSTIKTDSKIHPFINVNFKYGFLLKDYNVLEFGIHFRNSFSDIYNGFYFNPEIEVPFSGSGTELGVNLGYTFSGYSMRLVKRKSKKELLAYRKSRREIGAKAILIEISAELFSYLNSNNDPEGIILNNYSQKYAFRAELEFGLDERRFVESGLHFGSYCTGYLVLHEDRKTKFRSKQSGPEYQTAISIGYGYRLQTKKNTRIITLSAGVALNGSQPSGGRGSSSLRIVESGYYIYKIEWLDEHKTIIYPTVYANVNRDFQMTKKMFLSLNFRYNLGLIDNFVRNYTAETYGSSVRSFQGKRNGTSFAVGVGLKYNLGERKRSDEH
jgi:hypothetical protein